MRLQNEQKGHTLQAHETRVWNVQGYVADYGPVDGLQLPPEFDKFKVTAAAQSMLNCHKRHMCGFCKKVFPLKNLLRRHVQFGCKMNPRNSQFACSFCQYKSTYKANMERHVRNVHDTGVLKFRCDLCNFRSNYSFCVRRHMKTFHPYRKMYMGDQVLGYTCTMCSKFYKMWSNYLKHKCEPPQFKCPLCPFAAFKAFILHAHQAEQHFKVTSPNT
ncbi:RE1-silencing transcription factor-like [Apis dorsata]|uniref:RE1-silencing transcription factor-like n=1 Tax=Apis dorsata TaxID=7462 RepID=UPI001292DD75|nr:RE1-silencing transcription factor-like [Apis dorsata]